MSFKNLARPIAIIQGVGPGTGAELAKKFASRYPVILLSRNESSFEPIVHEINASEGQAIGFAVDISDHTSVQKTFEKINQLGPDGRKPRVAIAIANAIGGFLYKAFLDTTVEEFNDAYSASGNGAFMFSRNVIPLLQEHKLHAKGTDYYQPTLIFTGATASIKGSARFGAFAASKFAIRALSQSLAREFAPEGIHVAHMIVDGMVDTPGTRNFAVDPPDGKITPHSIADAYWFLHTQPKSAFTQEMDIRTYAEKW